jgi:hypothetical protein
LRRAVFFLALVACKPDLGPPDSLLSTTHVIAVKSEPAEAKPGTTVVLRALVASPSGTVDGAPLVWSFCAAPKPITENNVVSTACLGVLPPFGGPAAVVAGVIPSDACSNFGPDAPPGGFRPRDPDVTGGYFQPIRADLGSAEAFALQRVTCDLANTSADNAREFAARYTPNKNPTLAPVTATIDGAPASLGAIPSGACVDFQAAWGPNDAETYVRLDPGTQQIVEMRESLRVSWYATNGAFDADRTGRDENDPATTTGNAWIAPSSAGVVHLWLVLRDSRGGSDWAAADVTVVGR